MPYQTEQENFWAGDFGSEYIGRNQGADRMAANLVFFKRILESTQGIRSVIEFGANIGLNLQALRRLIPDADFSAIEINREAAQRLKESLPDARVIPASILDFKSDQTWDFALVKGVLIHIHPERLSKVYDALYRASRRYLCIAEYYNPTPVSIPYRGHSDRLFKRDFAGEMLGRYPDLRLADYGFAYHGDARSPQDDITWFLLEKTEKKSGEPKC